MIKKYIQVVKDYSKWIGFKDLNLILFILFNTIANGINLLIPIFTSAIISAVTAGFYESALTYVIFLLAIYTVRAFFSYGDYYFYASFFRNTYINTHKKIVDSAYEFTEDFDKKLSFGKIINSSNMEIINVAEVPSFIFEILIQIVKYFIMIYFFFRSNILVGFFVLAINFIYLRLSIYCNRNMEFHFRNQRKYGDKLTSNLSQILHGIKDVKNYNLKEKLNIKLNYYRKKWGVHYFMRRKYLFTKLTFVVFIEEYGQILLYIFLISLMIKGRIDLATFLILISYYEKTKYTTEEIINDMTNIDEEAVSLYRVIDTLTCKDESPKYKGTLDLDEIEGKIEFKNVTFQYEMTPILKNVSFKIEPCKMTAIIGETGVGKTTILNLIMRQYIPNNGKIFIDDEDIFDYDDDVYGTNVTIVNQTSFMFNMSIRQNLSLVDSDRKRQVEACKRVGIHDYIMSLPKGYNTVISERMNNLSGGQKQLLSLARALLTTSEILLLDEITSALDPKTTKHILTLLKDLKKDHTVVIITHNKEVMKNADHLIMLKKAKVVAQGKHEELIKINKDYIELIARNPSLKDIR